MKYHTYKLVIVDEKGEIADLFETENESLVKDFRDAADRQGNKYLFECHSSNKWNNHISVWGYYTDGTFFMNRQWRNHYQYDMYK